MLKISDLHEYQKAGVRHIINNPFCGLFLDMGLGKTVTTLTAFWLLKYNYLQIRKALVIAPKRVAETVWAEECNRWEHLKHLTCSKIIGSEPKRIQALYADADIYIISRDNLAWLTSYYNGQPPFDMWIIDELSSFKSHSAVRFKAAKMARPAVKRLVGLTGTPAPNGLIDLWPQMYLIDLGERLGRTITAYREKYFHPGASNGHVAYSYAPDQCADVDIALKIGDICISMQAKDYLELPPVSYNYIRIDMPAIIAKGYKDFEKSKVLEIYGREDCEITAINAAALSNKLLQYSNGAVYDENHDYHTVHNLKLDALEEIIEASEGQPVLVAWTFQSDRDRIMERFIKLIPRELKSPKDIEDWNSGRVRLMLAHPASAGHGLNLQAGGNIIVWFGLTYSLELYQQFNARLNRQGQKHSVMIHHIVVNGTHDDDVIKALSNKDNTQNSLMSAIKSRINKYLKNRL